MMLKHKTVYLIIFLQFIMLVMAIMLGRSLGRVSPSITSDDLKLINTTVEYINKYYKDKDEVKLQDLTYGAVKGMVESLRDPYSQFLDAETYREVLDDTSGKFGGLGIEIGIISVNDQDRLTVISAFEGNPAHKAGIQPGDYITEIDGESTAGITLYEAKKKLRGEPGTKVSLKVIREHESEPLSFVVTRDIIVIKTVKTAVLKGNIGYIKLMQFSDTTPKDIDNALQELQRTQLRAIILDLRSNPGGTLSAAIDTASKFLKKGQLVVSVKGSRQEDNKEFRVEADGPYTDIPLVVLVDRWSASGSEIVVGAIKDHKRGVVIGEDESTFGKGSVQTIFPLDDKTGIKLTIAHYYSPNGTNIDGIGIRADIVKPGPTPSEIKTYRSLYGNEAVIKFVKNSDDNVLDQLNTNSRYKRMFEDLVKALSNQGIKIKEEFIKLAIAQKTKNPIDEYEYDPLIAFAIDYINSKVEGPTKLASN